MGKDVHKIGKEKGSNKETKKYIKPYKGTSRQSKERGMERKTKKKD
jgi:hypothetical protein